MTNKISSAEQAKAALIKLRSKGASLHVEFSVLFASFSFDGYLTECDGSALVVEAPKAGMESVPTLTLSGLQISNFDGDFREDEFGMFLTLMVTRPIAFGSDDLFRFHVMGGWSSEPTKGRHIN